jgi:hypothetical protein
MEDFHFGCAPTRALPSEAASRCTRPGYPPRTSRAAYTMRLCDDGVQGHTRSESTNKKARILCGIRASGIQSAAGVSVRHGCLPDRGNPRTRGGRVPAQSAGRSNTAGRRMRTHAGRQGLGRCDGRSGCSRWCPVAVPFEAGESSKGLGGALRAKDLRSSKRQDAV